MCKWVHSSCLYDLLRISLTYSSKNKNTILKNILRILIPLFEFIDLINKDKKVTLIMVICFDKKNNLKIHILYKTSTSPWG